MHDIKRDDILKKTSSGQKHKKAAHSHNSEDSHEHGPKHEEHSHQERDTHDDTFPGHEHKHEELDEHFHNDHEHKERFESRAYLHVHNHSHRIQHAHHHEHTPEENTFIHRIFNNPLQDWFALIFMSILLFVNKTVPMDDNLSDGILIVITVIGLFPLLKNAVFHGILKKRLLPELVAAIFLFVLIFYGALMTASVITIFIFLGSFLKLDFSWK